MVKHKSVFLMLLLVSLLVNMAFLPKAHAMTGQIIWSPEILFTVDPTYTYYDPDVNKTFTLYFTPMDEFPSATASLDNKIWVAWQSEVPPENPNGKFEIFYKVYNGNWSNGTQVTSSLDGDTTPAILATSDNKIWIFWVSSQTGNTEIFYKTSSNGGVSWSTDVQITNDTRNDRNPAVTQTADGKVWLVWSRVVNPTNGLEHIFYKTFNGIEWSTESELTTTNTIDQLPSITQAHDGKVWVFWSQNNTTTYQIVSKNFNGATWSNTVPLTSDTSYVNMDPTALTEQDGTIRIFWHRRRTNSDYYDIYYTNSSNNGATWPILYQFTTHQQYSNREPAAVQAADRSLWVFWTSTRDDPNGNPNYDVYVKHSVVGDVNHDGKIDTADLNTISKALTTTPSDPHGTDWGQWNPDCDLNADNKVNILDLAIAGINFGLQA
jgi:hypothetical protein